MGRSTRYYSNKQEKHIAKVTGGRKTPNSGATSFIKGDVITDQFLLEAKTSVTEKKSFSIKREWLEKNREEAFAMGKHYSALVFNFGEDTDNYYVINERLFKQLLEYIEKEEQGC